MKIIPCNVPDDFNLFLFGDRHEGSILSHHKGFNKFIDHLHTSIDGLPIENNKAVDHGDQVEAIMIDDPRYDPKTCDNVPLEQYENTIKDYEPIKDFLVCMLDGNHPWKLYRYGFVIEKIAERLGVPYGTFTSKILWQTKNDKLLFKSYHTHGGKSISSTADDPIRQITNMKLILKRHLKYKAGDTILMSKGHSHRLLIQEPVKSLYMVDDGKKTVQKYTTSNIIGDYIHPDLRWYINTGSFLRLFAKDASGYAERFEYDPTELGYALCKIRNRQIENIKPVIL